MTGDRHPTTSLGHGTWQRTGDRQFAATQWNLRFDDGGNFVGTTRVRSEPTLNETLDESTGRVQADVYDLEGNLVVTNRPTSRATRIRVAPLD